jgi:hypothetical protein
MKKQIFGSLIVLATVLSSASAFASDCRVKLMPSYDIQEFADTNTTEIAADIAEYIHKKRDFDISSDADAPYIIQYSISARGGNGDAVVQYMMSFQGPSGTSNANGKLERSTGREKKQAKLMDQAIKDLKSRLPSCPNL